jgi:hypothetical protein
VRAAVPVQGHMGTWCVGWRWCWACYRDQWCMGGKAAGAGGCGAVTRIACGRYPDSATTYVVQCTSYMAVCPKVSQSTMALSVWAPVCRGWLRGNLLWVSPGSPLLSSSRFCAGYTLLRSRVRFCGRKYVLCDRSSQGAAVWLPLAVSVTGSACLSQGVFRHPFVA